MDAPIKTQVTDDRFYLLGPAGSAQLPNFLLPPLMNNHGKYIVSLGEVVRWLGQQAEALGCGSLSGLRGGGARIRRFRRSEGRAGRRSRHRQERRAQGAILPPGIEIHAKYTLIGEGVRGSLAKLLIRKFKLDAGKSPQKFGIGLKELWEIPAENHKPGLVVHTTGWPLDDKTGGGSFMYHFGDRLVSIGFVVHLNYKNPWLSPFDEFQRMKTHPEVAHWLKGGKRLAYGARAITEGGLQSIPKLAFPGGALIGCSAGFVNVPRIKGSHNAMKSGMLAADAAFAAIAAGRQHDELKEFEAAVEKSFIYKDLKPVRNAKPILTKYGTFLGGFLGMFDMWTNTLFGNFSFFGTMKHTKTDAESTLPAAKCRPIAYPKPDGVLTFDKLSSVFLSATNHEEDQPVHLKVLDPKLQRDSELGVFGGPSNRYCPAGVYEWLDDAAQPGGSASRSTPRTASTARRATSRIRTRTSTGPRQKAVAAPITPTCDATVCALTAPRLT